jgi:hypothetical protein
MMSKRLLTAIGVCRLWGGKRMPECAGEIEECAEQEEHVAECPGIVGSL